MFYNQSVFPGLAAVAAAWPHIVAEYKALDAARLAAWPEPDLYEGDWRAFGLIAPGNDFFENQALCPITTQVVKSVPGLTLAGFSVLQPQTHIKPHRGSTFGILRAHLGVICPEGCRIRVKDAYQTWKDGEILVFDDTKEHEVWNPTGEQRVVLLMDIAKHPRIPVRYTSNMESLLTTPNA